MIRAMISTLVFAAFVATLLIADDKPHAANAGSNPAFDQFKLLAGDWVGKEKGKEGHEVHIQYKVTSGGTAVVETIMPGSDHEMVSVIHPDGKNLIFTHYCMLGNQPQMRAAGAGDGKKVEFKFVKATNMKSEKDMHMHEVSFTFVDKDTLKTEWTNFTDGKAAGQVVFELKRKQ
jgi:hypothetical protein